MATLSLARVKMMRPPLAQELVPRPRLLERLSDGFTNPLTLIAAPAGYGKSTLLTDWLRHSPHPAAWLSLDEGDDNLNVFTSYVIAAIQTIFPGSMQVMSSLNASANPPPPAQMATALSNEIAELPSEFILVLDDYHTIVDNAIHELMSGLIRHLPAPLHLCIATRTNVPLPVAKLRASGKLCELRARDLRFTLDEARIFLQRTVNADLSEELVQRLQTRIEGWAAGLRFATLLIRDGTPTAQVFEKLLSRAESHLMDFMLDEVLSQKSPRVQDFLLKTALLGHFTLGLADAVLNSLGDESNAAILDELAREDILIAERTHNEEWFKYLDVFREFLHAKAVARLDASSLVELNRRASAWFLKHDALTEAIEFAIAAGDVRAAAQIVGANLSIALDEPGTTALIELWLSFFPIELRESQVELVLAHVWQLSIELKLAAIPPLLKRTEQLLAADPDLDPDARRRMLGEIAYHEIFLAYFAGDGLRTLALIAENHAILPVESQYARGMSLSIQAWAYQMVGKNDVARQLLTNALQSDGSPLLEFTLRLLVGFTVFYQTDADYVNLEQISETTLRVAKGGSFLAVAAAQLALGEICYEWNQLEAAAQHFATAAELSHMGNLKVGHEGYAWLALTRQAHGLPAAADAALQDLLTFTDETHSGALLYDAAGYRARLALMQGNLEGALHWAQSVAFNPRPHMLFEVEANLTRLRILLATHKADQVRLMLAETDALLDVAQSVHDTRRSIQLYALQAMARDFLNRRSEALDSLEQAVTLAEPGRWLRTFIDFGAGMARLLNHLLARNRSTAYIRRILEACAPNIPVRQAQPDAPDRFSHQLIQPLTVRELQVLQGLVQRQTNKEIAKSLVISPQTVKVHIDHIFQKLNVNSRREAVSVALAFGIVEVPSTLNFFV